MLSSSDGPRPAWLPSSLAVAALLLAAHGPGAGIPPPSDEGRGSNRPAHTAAPAKGAPLRPLRQQYLEAVDLRSFVDRQLGLLADPETAFYVAQAMEECAEALAATRDDAFPVQERHAAAALAQSCRGFAGTVIDPAHIVELLRYAASWGEPHAMARMLLFRDAAASKDDMLPILPWMLTSLEPSIVRDVGAFLSRGEAQWRYGDEQVPTAVAALAWELVACDLDRACNAWSRFVLAQCAFLGRCATGRYEDALATFEPPELMAHAQLLRGGILRALRERDWEWLGLR
jgi:hypothetical protein